MSDSQGGRVFQVKGIHVLFAMIGFFALVFFANFTMIYIAVTTFSGVETEDAYRKGRDYNRILEAARTQAELGWTMSIDSAVSGQLDQENVTLTVAMADRDGRPLEGLEVNLLLRRPGDDNYDQRAIARSTSPGSYQTDMPLLGYGRWLIEAVAIDRSGNSFTMRKEVFLKNDN